MHNVFSVAAQLPLGFMHCLVTGYWKAPFGGDHSLVPFRTIYRLPCKKKQTFER